jgi:MYXO-CTERM domain-containing protein
MNRLSYFFLVFILAATSALGAPGAHGPDGAHLDGPAGHVDSSAGARIETYTELFELVGRLQGQELSILIDRYDTNQPVLNGKLEVELNGIKAQAKFHADQGDYAVDDAALLAALAKPGKHALMFTLTAGEDNDLLEATLEVSAKASAAPDDHDHAPWASASTWIALAMLAALAVLLRRRNVRNNLNRKTS